MKQIQVTIPTEEGTDIIKSLDEVVSPSQLSLIHGEETSVILITVSPTRTGFVLDHLANLGIGRVKGRISRPRPASYLAGINNAVVHQNGRSRACFSS